MKYVQLLSLLLLNFLKKEGKTCAFFLYIAYETKDTFTFSVMDCGIKLVHQMIYS